MGSLAHQGTPGRRPTWTRCHNPVEPGQVRCRDCWNTLATHPDPDVRIALAGEANIPEDIADFLAHDPDPRVVAAMEGPRS